MAELGDWTEIIQDVNMTQIEEKTNKINEEQQDMKKTIDKIIHSLNTVMVKYCEMEKRIDKMEEKQSSLITKINVIIENQKELYETVKPNNELPPPLFPFLDSYSFIRSRNLHIRKNKPCKFLAETSANI